MTANSEWTRQDTFMTAMIFVAPAIICLLVGLAIGFQFGDGKWSDGFCAALNAELIDGGKDGDDICVDDQGRTWKVVKP